MQRRQLNWSLLTLSSGSLPLLQTGCASRSKRRGHVVVIGGGFAGTTCARQLKKLDNHLEVTLIEARPTYTACPLSNLVVVGQRQLKAQNFNYSRLKDDEILVIHDHVIGVDPQKQRVVLNNGQSLGYDRLVVAPGVDIAWNQLSGYDEKAAQIMPHAWKAGPQTLLLQQQIASMKDGGLVLISAPENPFRCPPGPYERASLIAHYLKRYKPKSKLIILDAKDNFSKKPLFLEAWQKHYGDLIEWQGLSSGARVTQVNAASKEVLTDFDTFKADVINIVPPQRAGKIAEIAGCTNASGWCPIGASTFASQIQDKVYVLGDAAIANAMPKSAFSANAQAKLCAIQIVRNLQELPPINTKLINTCYSYVTPTQAISVADIYTPKENIWQPVAHAGGISQPNAGDLLQQLEAKYALDWFKVTTQEVFG
ncbi:MAG: NAD(P)/FAD-dependent oxidoreductase [Pseudomonadota bacterium]